MKLYLELFITFLKIGTFTFGGGYSMIPLIQREIAEKKRWMKTEEILDILAISGSLPGAISINSSTFAGYRIAGVRGALLSTLGLVLPSFVIILIISTFAAAFSHLRYVQYAFWGIRVGVLALIIKALFSMIMACPKNIFGYILMILAFGVAVLVPSLNVIYIILACLLIGLSFIFIRRFYGKGGRNS